MSDEIIKIVIDAEDKASQPIRNVSSAADELHNKGGAGLDGFREIAIGALRAVGEMAVQAGVQLAGAMVNFAKESVNAASTFEAATYGLQAVTGDSLAQAGFDIDDVREKALALGKDTEFSAQQAIVAMTELAKGGVPVKDVMGGATDATLALAAAASLDLGNAATIVAKQLGVWSETGVDAAHVSDLLASAANASTVDVEELALGLANVGGTAKTAGVSFDDLTQTMALIAPNFSSAADAGTSLKTFISRLIPTTDKATEAMMDLGLATEDGKSKFFDASGSFIGMEAAARLLHSATSGLSEEEKLLAFNTIFGSDAIRAAAAIANAGAEGYNAMGDAMTAAGGAATAAGIKQQGYAFAMEQMGGSIETLQIVIGTALLPILAEVVTRLTEGINVIMGFAQTFINLSSEFQTASDPINTFFNILAVAASSVIPGAGASILNFRNSILPAIEALQQLAAFVQANLPTALAIGGAAVAAVVGVFQGMAPMVVGVFMQIGATVQAIMPAIAAVVSAVLAQVMAFWNAHGAQIIAFLQTTWSTIGIIITTALQLLQGIIMGVLAVILSFIQEHGAQIQQVLSNAWTIISNVITGALAIIQGVLTAALAVFRGDWQGAWTAIQQMSVTVTLAIGNVIHAFLDTIAAFFGTTLDDLISQWSSIFSQLISISQHSMSDVLTALQGVLPDMPQLGKDIISGIIAGLSGNAGALANAAIDAAKSALKAAKEALGIKSPSTVFEKEVGGNIIAGMVKGMDDGRALVQQSAIALAGGAAVAAIGGANAIAGLISSGESGKSGRKALDATALASVFKELSIERDQAGASGSSSSSSAGELAGSTFNITYNRGAQDERSVRDDMRALSLLRKT